MVSTRWTGVASGPLGLLTAPTIVQAQVSPPTPSPPGMPAPVTGLEGGAAGAVVAVVALLAFFVLVGMLVKLYDRKRNREEEGVVLQARLSDVLLLDRSLSEALIVVSVHMPLWRRFPPVVEVTGTVATPELRDAALRRVERELTGTDARIEDRIGVDPLTFKRVA